MPKATVGDAEIYYEQHGNGVPLLLVPGLGGAGNYWAPNISAFSRNYRVIVHDHRGTGQSSRAMTRYSVDQMTADLVGLMDHLRIAKAHLVGHSTGGAIGQTMAVLHGERLISLVLYASWTKADAFFRRIFEARRSLLTKGGPKAYFRSAPIFLYPDWWINRNIAILEQRERAAVANSPMAEIMASRIDAVVEFDRTRDLANIKTPTLVVCAKDDFLTPPYFSRELSRFIPGSELIELERGGHCVSETNARDFENAVLEFIDRHP